MSASALRLAHGLAGIGVAPGDRVAALMATRVEMAEVIFGCARLGAVIVPLNTYLKGDFLLHQLADSASATVVVDAPGFAALAPLLPQLPDLRQVVLVDDVPVAERTIDSIPFSQLFAEETPDTLAFPARSDLFAIMYTSGTTGMPKGCMLSQGYVLHVGEAWAHHVVRYEPGDLLLMAFPLFHMSGMCMGLMSGAASGITIAIEPAFSASEFLLRARELGATITLGVGAMAHALLATPPSDSDREHSIRFCAWTPLPPDRQRDYETRFGSMVTTLGYGQTECVPITYDQPGAEHRRDTAGQPPEWLDVRIVDDDDNPVAAGTAGEIVLRPRRSHVMFAGYWNNTQATVAASRNLWHHTGDFARMDQDGYLTYVDRKKDALRRRGENVSSMQLEMAILTHPKVAEVAVHAVPSDATEDDIKACIITVPDQELSPTELFNHFASTLPYFAIPRYVELVAELPKNAMNRVLKHKLKDRPLHDGVWDLHDLGLVVGRESRRASAQSSAQERSEL